MSPFEPLQADRRRIELISHQQNMYNIVDTRTIALIASKRNGCYFRCSILVESPTLWIYSIAIGILLGDLAYSKLRSAKRKKKELQKL
jgi:hypothetical protein